MHKYGDCSLCGGEVKQKRVDELDYRYGGKLHIFKEVPAGVCRQCGEMYLTAKAAKEIERIIRGKTASKKTIPVPVYVFPEKIAV